MLTAVLKENGAIELFVEKDNGQVWHAWQTGPNAGWAGAEKEAGSRVVLARHTRQVGHEPRPTMGCRSRPARQEQQAAHTAAPTQTLRLSRLHKPASRRPRQVLPNA